MSLIPPGAGLHPVPGVQRSAALHPVVNTAVAAAADPLLAQALAGTRTQLEFGIAERSGALSATVAGAANSAGSKLHRCDPWVRVELGVAEAVAALHVVNAELWHVPPVLPPAGVPVPTRLFSITAPSPAQLAAMVPAVIDAADERADRMPEILVQDSDFWSFWSAITGIDPGRAPRTAELVDVAYRMATSVTMRIKADLDVARPSELSALVQPVLRVPGHGALPSGHAVVSHLFAELAVPLLGARATGASPAGASILVQLRRLAARVSRNRVVAGLHYNLDGLAGRALGKVLAAYFAALAQYQASAPVMDARVPVVPATPLDVLNTDFGSSVDASTAVGVVVAGATSVTPVPPGTYLCPMWQNARTELQLLGLAS